MGITNKCRTETQARRIACQYGDADVAIVQSRGCFFVELGFGGLIRSWERLIYQGKGTDAEKRRGRKPAPAITEGSEA